MAIDEELDDRPVRLFDSFTENLHQIADWLCAKGIESVAMESTGVYWVHLYNILEERGIEVLLVNARHLKNVPGRKTDVADCMWLQQLHSYGLLRGSFIPAKQLRELRSYVRQRDSLITRKGTQLNLIGKSLNLMNIKFGKVISDLEGVTGMQVIRAIAGGEKDPYALAALCSNKRLKATKREILLSLEGNYCKEHLFSLNLALNAYDFYRGQIEECELEIESVLQALTQEKGEDLCAEVQVKTRKARKNQYSFNVSEYLQGIFGVDLTRIPGLDEKSVLGIVSEVGTDLSKWKDHKHFTSWLGLAPYPKISGGKVLGHYRKKTNNRAGQMFRLCARTMHSNKGELGMFYRRLSHRKGKVMANKAVANKIARIFYNMVIRQEEYDPQRMVQQEAKRQARQLRKMQKMAEQMGLKLVKDSA